MPISATIPNLPAGTSIDVRVRAFNQVGFGPYSLTQTLSTASPPPPPPPTGVTRDVAGAIEWRVPIPGPPVGLTSLNATSSSVTLSWSEPTPATGGRLDHGVYSVTTSPVTATTAVPYCTPGSGTITDAFGNTWAVTAAGVVTVNSFNAGFSGSVIMLLLVNGVIWQENAGPAWWGWQPTSGPMTSAQAAAVSWNINPGTSVSPLSSVLISGLTALTAYTFSVTASNTVGVGAPATVAATTAGGVSVGPSASSGFLTADFTAPMNYPGGSAQQVVSQRMYGTYMGYGADAASRGGTNTNSFAAYTNPAFSAAMAIANPGLFVVTGNTTFGATPFWTNDGLGNPTVVNPVAMNNLVNNFYKVDPLGISGILFGANFDQFSTAAIYGQAMGNLAAWWNNGGAGRVMPNDKPVPFIGCIGHNEPDGTPIATIAAYYSAMAAAVKAVSSSYVVLGPIWSFYQGSNTNSFIQACTTKPDGISWDAFNDGVGSSSPLGSAMYTNPTYAKSFQSPGISNLFAGDMPAGYAPTSVMVAGNVGFNGNRPDMWTVNGAMFFAVNHWNNLSACQTPMWLATWDDGGQTFNGLVGDTSANQNGSGIVVTPTAYYFGAGVRTVFGPRWQTPTNSANLKVIATSPSSARFGVMIVNDGHGAQNGKTVALSHWPVNTSGNGTANVWQMTNAVQGPGQDGASSTVIVTGGVTAALNFPDPSITIISV